MRPIKDFRRPPPYHPYPRNPKNPKTEDDDESYKEPEIPGLPRSDEDAGTSADVEMASSSNTVSLGNQETPVLRPPRIDSNFFEETCTVTLPLTFYLSANNIEKNVPVLLVLGLNSPYNILGDNQLAAQTINNDKVFGLSNCNSRDLNTDNFSSFTATNNFPVVIKGSTPKTTTQTSSNYVTDANCRPARRSYYEKVYEFYTTLGCTYSIEMESLADDPCFHASCFYQNDTVTTGSTGDVMPKNRSIQYYRTYPGVKEVRLERKTGSNYTNMSFRNKIQGSWRPGTLHHNVKNTEDVKTWNAVGAVPANGHRETLSLLFMSDWQSQSSTENCVNLKIFMEWTVQFKDLRNAFRYPFAGDATQNLLVYPADFLQVPFTTETVP
jgi:hypothetical protein